MKYTQKSCAFDGCECAASKARHDENNSKRILALTKVAAPLGAHVNCDDRTGDSRPLSIDREGKFSLMASPYCDAVKIEIETSPDNAGRIAALHAKKNLAAHELYSERAVVGAKKLNNMNQTKQSSDATEAKNTSQAQSLKGLEQNVEPQHPSKSTTDLKAALEQNILKMLTGSYDAQWCDKAPAMIEFRDSFSSCADSKKVHETIRIMTHITARLDTFEALMAAIRANEEKVRPTSQPERDFTPTSQEGKGVQ